MKVKALYSAHLLGTDIILHKGCIYDAEPATNQTDYKEKLLYFVTDPKHPNDPMLCTLGDEIRKCHCWDYLPRAQDTIMCVIDSHAGIYAPQEFVKQYEHILMNCDEDDLHIVKAGPHISPDDNDDVHNEGYWDAWDTIESKGYVIQDHERWNIQQHDDIFLVAHYHIHDDELRDNIQKMKRFVEFGEDNFGTLLDIGMGCYPTIYVCKNGDTLCADCAQQSLNDSCENDWMCDDIPINAMSASDCESLVVCEGCSRVLCEEPS